MSILLILLSPGPGCHTVELCASERRKDLRLPEKNGFALIHELRLRTDPVAMIPAASITASRLTEDRHHALAAGYQVHMEKPVDPDDLVSTVLTLAATPRENDRIGH